MERCYSYRLFTVGELQVEIISGGDCLQVEKLFTGLHVEIVNYWWRLFKGLVEKLFTYGDCLQLAGGVDLTVLLLMYNYMYK